MGRPVVPWDSPSRYGRLGLFARRLVARVARPLTVRLRVEHDQLAAQIEQLERRVDELASRAEQQSAYARALDALLASTLPGAPAPDVVTRSTPAGSCRRAICSLATGPYRALLSRSAVSFERYAERWGWEVVLCTEDLGDGRPASWGTVRLLRSLLDEYDWVLFLDADVVIVDLEADISAEVQEGKDLYLVEHRWDGQYTANFGVVLIRASDWSRSFLDEVWAQEQFIDHPWWENAAALTLLGYALAPARLVEPTAWLKRTKLIDRRWNSIELDRAPRPAFVHRGFYDVETRIRQVTGDLLCVLAGADPATAGYDQPPRLTGSGGA